MEAIVALRIGTEYSTMLQEIYLYYVQVPVVAPVQLTEMPKTSFKNFSNEYVGLI